ncbi:hypothetical protein [Nocardia sp. 852002-20019_SCH5090214]|uniref:hypothetical protein n=1 Tax=Nocardia sp. 852002-20019_SCH5090214 TaxID=1834087 RepID=UPI000AC3ED34|nr:hypothetical protein [Nocardia sp. 852002-20019_SCH5090214]
MTASGTTTVAAEPASAAIESALAADIGAVAAVLRELIVNADNPAVVGELSTLLERHASVLARRTAGLGGGLADLDGVALADFTRVVVPPELRAVIGRHPEGDML